MLRNPGGLAVQWQDLRIWCFPPLNVRDYLEAAPVVLGASRVTFGWTWGSRTVLSDALGRKIGFNTKENSGSSFGTFISPTDTQGR